LEAQGNKQWLCHGINKNSDIWDISKVEKKIMVLLKVMKVFVKVCTGQRCCIAMQECLVHITLTQRCE